MSAVRDDEYLEAASEAIEARVLLEHEETEKVRDQAIRDVVKKLREHPSPWFPATLGGVASFIEHEFGGKIR